MNRPSSRWALPGAHCQESWVLEQVVSFLFKYRGAVFSKGHFSFGAGLWVWIAAIIALALAATLYFSFFRKNSKVPPGFQVLLIGLRCLLFAVIFFCLMRPIVVVPSVVPQSSYAAVLMDNSASMKIIDQNGAARLDSEKGLMSSDSPFYQALENKFKIKAFGFSGDAQPLSSAQSLNGDGEQTNLPASLSQAARNMAGTPLAGIVLMTDGASNSAADLNQTLNELKTRGTRVYVIGMGSPELKNDLELVRVSAPSRLLAGSPLNAELEILASDTGDRAVKVDITEDGHPVKSQDVAVHSGGATQVARVRFTPTSPGIHNYKFTLDPLPGESITANNSQEVLVNVEDANPRILYIEGEPRWEYGKIRESLYEEKNLHLVSILRSADGKFYRQGVDNADELSAGFPKSDEELFKYDGVVLGSVEATFFTFDQLTNIEDFVAKRGGALLALGGSKSFDGGGYVNTPMADLLPLYLTGQKMSDWETQTFKARPSDRERDNPVARLVEQPEANAKAWDAMPAITIPETLSGVKPGASVVLEAQSVRDSRITVPLLAEERYGRGRTMAFTASDTWRWRMMLESSNTSFETFWRNLLRYLVQNVRRQTEVTTDHSFYGPGEQVRLRADVADNKYDDVTNATVTAHITSPSGKTQDVQMKPVPGQDFNGYQAAFTPEERGQYGVNVTVEAGQNSKNPGPLESGQTSFLTGKIDREAFGAAQNRDLLKRIAAETGGGYYTPDIASNLVEDMSHSGAGESVLTSFDLWDMPINFLLVVALASAEWFIRKRKGLA